MMGDNVSTVCVDVEENIEGENKEVITSENTRPTKRQKLDSNIEEKICEKCQTRKPRSKYSKKQWSKIYGGWTCKDCSNQVDKDQKKKLKQQQHDQKISDQQAKKDGTFFDKRSCFQCRVSKLRDDFTGKQWKQLYRQCKECIQRKGLMKIRIEDPTEPTSGTRYCSGCKETKFHNNFTGDQWRHPVDAERLCKPCWKMEGEAKREHRELSEQHKAINPNLKRCYACHEFLSREEFSKKQQKKVYGFCTSCIQFLRDDRQNDNLIARKVSTRACSICGKHKTIVDFGRGQWKRSDARCRPCATELVQRMDKHRQLEKDYNNNQPQGENDEGGSTAQTKKRRCFQCGEFKDQPNYSNRQWTKIYPSCLTCVKEKNFIEQEERKSDANSNTKKKSFVQINFGQSTIC